MDLSFINIENLDNDVSPGFYSLLNDNISAISSYTVIGPKKNINQNNLNPNASSKNNINNNNNVFNNIDNITDLSNAVNVEHPNVPNTDTDGDNEDDDKMDVDVLKKMVIRWIKLDDTVKEYNKQAKDLKDEKGQIESKILLFMNNNETNEIQVKDGKLEKRRGEKKEPINEEYIKKCLVKSFDDVEMVDKLTKVILENREITETYKLSRKVASKTKPKKN